MSNGVLANSGVPEVADISENSLRTLLQAA
jgi:hypothetical protein